MTKEQIEAHHNFFIRRYKIDTHPVEWNHEACLHVQRLEFQMMLQNSRISCDEANAWIIHTNNPHPDGATREAFKRIFQEKRSRWPLKIIIFRLLKMIIFRTHEWDIVNIIHLWKIQVALKSWLNFMKCLKSQGCFQK